MPGRRVSLRQARILYNNKATTTILKFTMTILIGAGSAVLPPARRLVTPSPPGGPWSSRGRPRNGRPPLPGPQRPPHGRARRPRVGTPTPGRTWRGVMGIGGVWTWRGPGPDAEPATRVGTERTWRECGRIPRPPHLPLPPIAAEPWRLQRHRRRLCSLLHGRRTAERGEAGAGPSRSFAAAAKAKPRPRPRGPPTARLMMMMMMMMMMIG